MGSMANATMEMSSDQELRRTNRLRDAVAAFCQEWFAQDGSPETPAVKTGEVNGECWARVEVPRGVFTHIAYGPTESTALVCLLQQITHDIQERCHEDSS